MVFKKYDEQQVYQVEAKNATGGELKLKVGEVIGIDCVSREISKIANKSAAEIALADQNELYLIAQSDDITEKLGTAYKTYKISDEVVLDNGETKIIAAYRITMIDNVTGEGWEA